MHLLIVGGGRTDRVRAASACEKTAEVRPAAIVALDAATLPFVRPASSRLPPARPRLVRLANIERAFPNAQKSGTRLVLTQSTYTLQKWLDALDPGDRIVATADRTALARVAPEAFQARGPWRHFELVDVERPGSATEVTKDQTAKRKGSASVPVVSSVVEKSAKVPKLLARAFSSSSAAERARLCRHAVASAPDSAIAALALASACLERHRVAGARAALDAAIRLAPDWEAVHHEDGKFWLGCEDIEQARQAFERAATLMPNFSTAFSNLGATLGELEQPDAALTAFNQALAGDPESSTILNNIGVVNRELGRLAESEAACRRVVAIAPDFVFGHYNLGHTLFLAGRFPEALAAYEEGQRRDPEKNRRQGCRLAIVRFANGDAGLAERDLWQFADAAPADEREDLLLEAYEIVHTLVRANPQLGVHKAFLDRITAEIKGS